MRRYELGPGPWVPVREIYFRRRIVPVVSVKQNMSLCVRAILTVILSCMMRNASGIYSQSMNEISPCEKVF